MLSLDERTKLQILVDINSFQFVFHGLITAVNSKGNKMKGKEEYLYSAFLHQGTHKALRHESQFYLQITPCLPFLRERSG